MSPNQTAPWEWSDMGPYCLQSRLPKNKSRQKEADNKGLSLCIQEIPKWVL